jgi:hypothetical protein
VSSLTPALQCVGRRVSTFILCQCVSKEKNVCIIILLSDATCSCITVLYYLLLGCNEFFKVHTEKDILDQ